MKCSENKVCGQSGARTQDVQNDTGLEVAL